MTHDHWGRLLTQVRTKNPIFAEVLSSHKSLHGEEEYTTYPKICLLPPNNQELAM